MNKKLCRQCAWPIYVHIDGLCPKGATPPQKLGRYVYLPVSLYHAAEKAGYDMHDFMPSDPNEEERCEHQITIGN
jgi:hypothetical protein